MDFKEHQKLVSNMQKLKKNQAQKAMKGSRHGLLPPLAGATASTHNNGSSKKELAEEKDEEDSISQPQPILSEKPTLSNIVSKESATT
jgi:hypothetical protein